MQCFQCQAVELEGKIRETGQATELFTKNLMKAVSKISLARPVPPSM